MKVIEVVAWLDENQLTRRKFANEYKVTEQFVGQFVKGRKTSKGLTDYFISKGCPKKYFKKGRVAA